MNKGDLANATVGFLRLAMAQRMQERWVEAKSSYKVAYETAVRTGDAVSQAKALRWMAMVESDGLQNYDAAVSNVEEAIRLAASGADKKVLYEALELKATIQATRGDLIAAADTINQAYAKLGQNCDERDPIEQCTSRHSR